MICVLESDGDEPGRHWNARVVVVAGALWSIGMSIPVGCKSNFQLNLPPALSTCALAVLVCRCHDGIMVARWY